MKPREIRLAADDQKAIDWARENLRVCASERSLSRKLMERLNLSALGSCIAIVPDWVDLTQLASYTQGSIPPNRLPYADGESPRDALVDFTEQYLLGKRDAVVVCDNTQSAMKSLEVWTWSDPPRFARYRDEVFYILTATEATREVIDGSLSDSLWRWGIAVCSACSKMPSANSADDTFIDEIVTNTEHILMQAFDGDGYLIWTPAHI